MTSFDLTTLRAKTRNPRKISAADKAALAKSIAEFSKMLSLRPIVYDPVTMEVLGGNQRLVALKEAGYKEVPAAWVRSADELTEEEKRRFVVQDNAQAGEWDTELLLADYAVEELKDWGVDLPEFDVTEADTPPGHGEANYADEGVGAKSQFGVIVLCDGETHQIEVFEKLQAMGYNVKVVVT